MLCLRLKRRQEEGQPEAADEDADGDKDEETEAAAMDEDAPEPEPDPEPESSSKLSMCGSVCSSPSSCWGHVVSQWGFQVPLAAAVATDAPFSSVCSPEQEEKPQCWWDTGPEMVPTISSSFFFLFSP